METVSVEQDEKLEALLEYLKSSRGFDFTGYKRGSLARRIRKRMSVVHIEDFSEYVDFLEVHPEEFAALFDTVLINVTRFFRDPESWQELQETVLPAVIGAKSAGTPIRVWSAATASGEEAYTAAIVLAELLGIDEFRRRVKIYATDVDEQALGIARQASYPAEALAKVPQELVDKYFEAVGPIYTFRPDLRRCLIFGRHDLVQDAPISRVDLLLCRNALMYFNADTQKTILGRLHFALNTGGVLFLGRAETLLTRTNRFVPIDLRRRLFAKAPESREREAAAVEPALDTTTPDLQLEVREAALEASPVAQILIDASGRLVHANERARVLFGISVDDLQRPLQELQISYRPLDLRSRIDEVYLEGRPVIVPHLEWPLPSGDVRDYEVRITPLQNQGVPSGIGVTFTDITISTRLQHELELTYQKLGAAYEELQSTNEELETTNEELQSTVEELETTNEELQSSNEELETMNEELQSTNEVLYAVSEGVRLRGDQVEEVNEFLEAVLSSLGVAVAIVDRTLRITLWNSRATDLWGVRSDEVIGKELPELDIGLPVATLRPPLEACLAGRAPDDGLKVQAVDRRGRAREIKVKCSPLMNGRSEIVGAIVLME